MNPTNSMHDANPLGREPTGDLLRKFTIPSIIAMLVSSLYNIVDQFFIGQAVGPLGNAATNIAFPLSTSCIAIALLFGIGGASSFNIALGEGRKDEAVHYMGNAAAMLFCCGLALCFFTQIFLDPLLRFFGSPDDVLTYAKTYTRITSLGFPFLILTTGGGHLIRADGRPRVTMLCNMSGAVVNTILDALFVFGFHWGMAGAAAATIIGQIFSAILVIGFLRKCRSVSLHRDHLMIHRKYVSRISSLGVAPFSNQVAMMTVQIVMNNSLKYYGSLSVYGEAIPIACVGIITKVNMLYMSFIIGISQGLQPIASFNHGAGRHRRVRQAYLQALGAGALISLAAFALFQLAPRQIISLFGDGSDEYFAFAISYFRIFLFFTFLNFLQPITSNFFTAIGKPKVGAFLSLTRQIIFLLPLLILFPLFMGIDGIMYAGPVADFLAAAVNTVLAFRELRQPQYQSS